MISFFILFILSICGIVLAAVKHGEQQDGKYNVFITIFSDLLQWTLIYFICKSGAFYTLGIL